MSPGRAPADRVADRRPPVGFDDGTGLAHLGEDRQRVLAARVVAGEDRDVGARHRRRAHQRALARVAVTAAAEHHDDAARGDPRGPRRAASARPPGCGRSRPGRAKPQVVGDALHPAGNAWQLGDPARGGLGIDARRRSAASARERVADVEVAGQPHRGVDRRLRPDGPEGAAVGAQLDVLRGPRRRRCSRRSEDRGICAVREQPLAGRVVGVDDALRGCGAGVNRSAFAWK